MDRAVRQDLGWYKIWGAVYYEVSSSLSLSFSFCRHVIIEPVAKLLGESCEVMQV